MRITNRDNQGSLATVEINRTCVNTNLGINRQNLFVVEYVRQVIYSDAVLELIGLLGCRRSYQEMERYDGITTIDSMEALLAVRCTVFTRIA